MTDADKKPFFQVFARLAVALRGKDKPDPLELRVYFDGLADLEIEFVTAAADSLARRAAFGFPKLPDWRREAQRLYGEREAAQRAFLRRLPEPLCSDCDDTGWREVRPLTPANDRPAPSRRARCACQHQRRLELLGRAPWPALPPGAEHDDRPLTRSESATLLARFAQERGAPLAKAMPNVARTDAD